MLGTIEQLPDRCPLDDLTGIHDRDVVAHLGDNTEVVRDQEDAHPQFFLEIAQEIENLRLNRDIEGCGWFISDEEFWIR